ncbi:hypothetical protein [Novosphingobium album (ex Liu et al. 2023)]|uniref:Acyl-protein synthetase LuxE domain-containing protein n=1 Tax=Novosphingobium album (ex Liu et al. 2023) TaxID=3031130 RepID=A0ABT5WLG3_9SPHN|nr:hypothetical protein [Novosphingobium album (ex Liu et al. 2023)]MDE8650883.1 hypothetical protein [Novosphingobium album (ex Liu et al. 2023)]
MELSLLPENPAGWPQHRFEDLFAIPREEREALQLKALQLRFARMRDRVPALQKLADRQGVDHIATLHDVLPVCFDHRVLKNYPLSVLENRDFPRLTRWLDKLTMHDLSRVDLAGLETIDDWLDRLDRFGMLVTYSSGTTGKLSFVPRSRDEFGAWRANYFEVNRAACGIDSYTTRLPMFNPTYRTGHQTAIKMMGLFQVEAAGGWDHYHTLYPGRMSADLLALAGKLQAAEDKGDVASLGLDPALLELRREMIEQGRRREEDMEAWFGAVIRDFRGRQVRMGGMFADMFRVARAGLEKGMKCEFAPGSVMVGGGGMKGYKDAPADWEDQIKRFFGIAKLGNLYGFSECIGNAPLCDAGFFHFMPYAIPIVTTPDMQALPREGVQIGRMVLIDLLAESCWGGFASGDIVTIHWDEDCPCGWKGPRVEKTIQRMSVEQGGDDKITCAGSQAAYNEFMDFVMGAGD